TGSRHPRVVTGMAAPARCRLVVLISGRGTNLQAIIEASEAGRIPATIAGVISNRPNAAGLDRAKAAGIPTEIVDHRAYASREEFERALADPIDRSRPDLVVRAGIMRILGRYFIARYAGRPMNIHPSLLPAFPGLDTHARALAAGVRAHGASVHFVTNEVDA